MDQLFGLDSKVVFAALVGLVAAQRLFELSVSARNVRRARERGGVEAGAGLYRWMVTVHTGFLVCAPLEVLLLGRPWIPPLAALMATLLLCAQALRYWTIRTLGERWTTRVIYVSGDPLVGGGPFRWFRHPNYVAVVMEFVALPLIHTAWLTAAGFSAANLLVLRRRIAVEENVLRRHGRHREDHRQ